MCDCANYKNVSRTSEVRPSTFTLQSTKDKSENVESSKTKRFTKLKIPRAIVRTAKIKVGLGNRRYEHYEVRERKDGWRKNEITQRTIHE